MTEFGHYHATAAGIHFDIWGAGPFVIAAAPGGKTYRFEDSDRVGPVPLKKDGDIREPGYFGEGSPFWHAWQKWVDQGRRLAPDDITCWWDEEYPA